MLPVEPTSLAPAQTWTSAATWSNSTIFFRAGCRGRFHDLGLTGPIFPGVMVMQTLIEPKSEPFIDRRSSAPGSREAGSERRQFKSSGSDLRPEVAELAQAVDRYKL